MKIDVIIIIIIIIIITTCKPSETAGSSVKPTTDSHSAVRNAPLSKISAKLTIPTLFRYRTVAVAQQAFNVKSDPATLERLSPTS